MSISPRRLLLSTLVAAALVLPAVTAPALAQEGEGEALRYEEPSEVIKSIILAPQTPLVSLGPDNTTMLLMEIPGYPSIAELAERELRLAGMRIKPQTNGPSRSRPFSGLRFMAMDSGKERPISGLPGNARIENVTWSPDGSRVAFTNTTSEGISLWMAGVKDAKAKRLTDPILSLTANIRPTWLPDNGTLLCVVVPEDRGPEPAAPGVPAGPTVQENIGQTAPARTYQDLLENAHDEALFDFYFTSQIARVNTDGKLTRIGEPGVYWDVVPSPDGLFILTETLHRPYSYLVPASRFPNRVEIRDAEGRTVKLIADLPLQEGVPIAFGSVPTGPRSFEWRADAPATLSWAEAQDGGDAGAEAEIRDKVFILAAPFSGDPVELATLGQRYGGVMWGTGDLAMVTSWWWKTRNQRAWWVKPDRPAEEAKLVMDHSWEDRYNDPGTPEMRRNAYGRQVLMTNAESNTVYLVGDGASDEGDRPFLDRHDLVTGEKERLFRSEAPYYERPVQVLDEEGRRVLTRREGVEQPPNYFLRDFADGTMREITSFPHPYPQLLGVQKEMIRYQRKDGVQLTGTLYLPPGYDPAADGPLPTVLWAYPQEFKSADAAGQVTDSPYRFVRVGWWSPIIWVARGYAVLDDPTLPIVGEGDEEPNDTYVEQLVAGAEAAVDELVRRGVGDRSRMAIGGHSYGAFMTANLLAHSDLFAAGVARSGAYNRTLTPFGFQAEERSFWEAPEVYFEMSPFMHADRVNEPILLIHGEADNNSGTFPMQSERFYSALKGHGATTRLVMLPHESHGYRAEESILHMTWETERWLDEYVKEKSAESGS